MDFSVIFQLRTKKFWWMDVIFYFVISLLVSTVLCYFIFLFKNGMIEKQIANQMSSLQTVGTPQQKEHEAEVMMYQKKIGDFAIILKDHGFASNVFAFMQKQTMSSVWFSNFSLDRKGGSVNLSGESDDLDAFSRQVAILEKNKYVKSLGSVNSSLGQSARATFSLSITLDQSIFDYLSKEPLIMPEPPLDALPLPVIPSTNGSTTTESLPPVDTTIPPIDNPPSGVVNTQKLINSFHFLLDPEIVGVIDQVNYTVTLNVPYGTDLKNLTPSIVVSPGTTVQPASLLSQDFTSPIIYKVIDQAGVAQNYQVKIIVAPAPVVENEQSNQLIISILIIIVSVIAIIIVIAWLLIKKRNKKIK